MMMRNYWEKENQKKGNYTKDEDIKVIDILRSCEDIPKSWSLSLNEEEYKIVSLMDKASRIIGFKVT